MVVLGIAKTYSDYMSYGDTLTLRGGYSVVVLGNLRTANDFFGLRVHYVLCVQVYNRVDRVT